MRIGLVGLPQAGKKTIFTALSGRDEEEGKDYASRTEPRITTVKVPDDRLPLLESLFRPKKTTFAQLEYLLPPALDGSSPAKSEGGIWGHLRACEGLVHVVRNFPGPGHLPVSPEKDFWKLEEEMILSDLVVTEKRIERIEREKNKGKKPEGIEYDLLQKCRELLDRGQPLRDSPSLAAQPSLKGFTFLSAKPMLVLVNNDDEDEALPEWKNRPEGADLFVVRGRLERDLARLTPEEAEEFREAYHLQESGLKGLIERCYRLLGRITFFTVISDEVRAWPIPERTPALEAAGVVHTDMKKGFIRAEVLSFKDLEQYGSFQEAKKVGHVRLEGKEYVVEDGDIISFRFNL